MREKYRKSIASLNKFPQFTTMNVIDGQAGLISYTSLIFYSLTIDNILNIIVLLILAGVSIVTLTGENGILAQAENAKTSNKEGEAADEFALIASEWAIEKNTSNKTLGEFLNEKLKDGKITSVEDNENGHYTIKLNDYQTIINQNGEIGSVFNPEEWDKTANLEDCFIWEDTTIIGLNMDKLSGVEKIRIPSKCTKIRSDYSIGNESYRNFVTGIKKVEIPDTVIEIGDYSFLNFKQLEEVKIPNSVKKIGDWAFSWCTSLKEISIPDSVEYIGNSAFNMSYNLTSIRLSNNLTELKSGIFYGCNVENIVIPNKVTKIEQRAFVRCSKLKKVILSENLINIEYLAFGYCESLNTITIPSSVVSIDDCTFEHSTNLNDIKVRKTENSISNSPWGATNATVTWNYTGD